MSPFRGSSLRNHVWVPEKVMLPLPPRPWPACALRRGACPLTGLGEQLPERLSGLQLAP